VPEQLQELQRAVRGHHAEVRELAAELHGGLEGLKLRVDDALGELSDMRRELDVLRAMMQASHKEGDGRLHGIPRSLGWVGRGQAPGCLYRTAL